MRSNFIVIAHNMSQVQSNDWKAGHSRTRYVIESCSFSISHVPVNGSKLDRNVNTGVHDDITL